MVAEIVHRGTTPKTIATQPAPPPRSTPLQVPEQQSQCADIMSVLPSSSPLPSSASLEENSGRWGPASSGDTSANSYSLPTTSHIANESPNNQQDLPSSVPDTTTSVTGADKKAPENATTAESSSNNPNSPFDDVISFSTFHPAPSSRGEPANVENTSPSVLQSPEPPQAAPVDEGKQSQLVGTSDGGSQQIQPNGSEQRETGQGRAPPPVPVRGSSVLVMTAEPLQGEREESAKSPSQLEPVRTEEISTAVSSGGSLGNEDLSEARRKLKRIPSIQERKRRLEAQVNTAGTPQSQSAGEKPGRLVISEALGGVSAGMPGSQHPLLVKKQEEAAARKREEREREEQERLEMEKKEKKEKEERERITRRFPFKRSVKGKKEEKGMEAKEQENRRSMTESERDELQNAFQRVIKSRPTSPESHSLALVEEGQLEMQSPAEKKDREEEETRKEEVDEGKVDEEVTRPAVTNADPAPQPPPPTCQPPPPPPPRSGGSSRSSTLDRTTKPPPSSSPPSLPGSIDRRTRHGSKPSTLERTSRSGSRPGTLERKNPPPAPTSHPPPVPEDVRKEQQTRCQRLPSVAGHGFSGGRLELADLIPGVSRRVLTEQTPSSSSTSPPRRYTITNGQAGPSPGPINAKRSVKERRSSSRRGHF